MTFKTSLVAIENLHRLPRQDRAGGCGAAARRDWEDTADSIALGFRRRKKGADVDLRAIKAEHAAADGAADPDRALGDRVEGRLDIGRRR